MDTIEFEKIIHDMKNVKSGSNKSTYVTNYISIKYLNAILGNNSNTKHCLCLTPMCGLNDELEIFKTNSMGANAERLFILSYTRCNNETVPMWLMYGGSNFLEKMSYSINLYKLVDAITQGNHQVFIQVGDGDLQPISKEDYKLVITKIIYTCNKNDCVDKTENDCYVLGANTVECDLNELITESEGIEDITNNLVGKMKNSAWSNEREIRILVELKANIRADRIFIKVPDEIFDDMIIKKSPWNPESVVINHYYQSSIFANMLTRALPRKSCQWCKQD